MIKLGIRAHDVATTSPSELARRIHELGFDGMQLVFKKALSEPVDFSTISDLKKAFLPGTILMLGAYFNPVHPQSAIREEGIAYFKKHLEIARDLNTSFVGTETGSLMGNPWGFVEENHSDETMEKLNQVLSDLVNTAVQNDTRIAIEGAWAHVAYSPKRLREVLDRIQSPQLKVTVDLFNYLHIGNYQDRATIFEECFRLFRDDIVIYHLKDFIVENNQLKQVGLGKGLMDFPTMIQRIKAETPNAFLIFEGVTGSDIPESFAYIHALLREEK